MLGIFSICSFSFLCLCSLRILAFLPLYYCCLFCWVFWSSSVSMKKLFSRLSGLCIYTTWKARSFYWASKFLIFVSCSLVFSLYSSTRGSALDCFFLNQRISPIFLRLLSSSDNSYCIYIIYYIIQIFLKIFKYFTCCLRYSGVKNLEISISNQANSCLVIFFSNLYLISNTLSKNFFNYIHIYI